MVRRKRREWEAEYVSEYCRAAFPGRAVKYHVRLGTWPSPLTAGEISEEERGLLRVRMRWADALVIGEGDLRVIEAKLRPSEFLKGLGELQLYTHLVPHTPELSDFKGWPVLGRLVIALPDPTVSWLVRAQKLEIAVFQPSFWTEYLNVLSGREKRAIRPEEHTLLKE